ncbi:MAG: bifunctional 4-hydroxy-2-oxoglutarate aldolase/2-dehydro-3-deoxy-phosphogluconate aldolase [Candidatus Caenarcaniphilales bacterium]|nr:bifunctional 4-hydroxy-2-oxoglutarate aldolase/2-dehydro-3-deoxy-phosphogluconate aldolase [Candidatus Caenarcaniphilales bacterium]
MNKEQIWHSLKKEKLISVIRANSQELAQQQIRLLSNSGLKLIEVSVNSVEFKKTIDWCRTEFSHLIIGAATVLDLETLKTALEANVDFIASPVFDCEIVQELKAKDILFIPGAASPTEIIQIKKQAPEINLIKLFPVHSVNFFESIKKIFPSTDFLLSGFEIKDFEALLKSKAEYFAVGSFFTDNPSETAQRVAKIKSLISPKNHSIDKLRSLLTNAQIQGPHL